MQGKKDKSAAKEAVKLRYTPREAEFADSSSGASVEDVLEADITITSGLIATFLAQMASWEALEVRARARHWS